MVWPIFALGIGLSVCTSVEDRMAVNSADGGSIAIGVGWPLSAHNDLLQNGIELAIKDVNSQGGVLGYQLEGVFRDDKGDIGTGKAVAQQFAENPNVNFVIGHYNPFISLPASVTYEYYGLTMLNPGTTDPKLTKQGFKRVFRMIPSDLQIGNHLAELAKSQGMTRMVIIYEQSGYGRQLANAIEFRAEELGILVPNRLSYDPGVRDYRLLFNKLRLLDIEGIFFAGFGADAQMILSEARQRGIDLPVFGGNGMDTQELFAGDPGAVEGTMVLSVFHIDNPNPYVQHFRKHFRATFGKEPDAWAAQGYDAIHLLAHAIRHAQSIDPRIVAEALHHLDPWYGVTGYHHFDDRGDVVGKPMVIKIARDGNLDFYRQAVN